MVRVSEANEPSECVSEARTTEPHTVQLNVTGPGQREEGQQEGGELRKQGRGYAWGEG